MDAKPFRVAVVTSNDRADVIGRARQRVIYCGPGIGLTELDALVAASQRLGDGHVQVMVDLDKRAFRIGYWGDCSPDALKTLLELGSHARVAPALRLGLLIVDDESLIYSPTAQSLEAETCPSVEPNGLWLNGEETERLVSSITTAGAPSTDQRQEITEQVLDQLKAQLQETPSPKPTDQRLLECLRERLQIVHFNVRGYKLSRRTMQLPEDIVSTLGSQNREINERLKASWKLFASQADKELAELQKSIEDGLAKLKKHYLVHMGDYGFALTADMKPAFTQVWDRFQNETVEKYKQEIKGRVTEMIERSKSLLTNLLQERISSGQMKMPHQKTLVPKSPEDQQKGYVEWLLGRVKWPTADQLASEVVVGIQYYDLSQELLSQQQFVAEVEKAFDCKLSDVLDQAEAKASSTERRIGPVAFMGQNPSMN